MFLGRIWKNESFIAFKVSFFHPSTVDIRYSIFKGLVFSLPLFHLFPTGIFFKLKNQKVVFFIDLCNIFNMSIYEEKQTSPRFSLSSAGNVASWVADATRALILIVLFSFLIIPVFGGEIHLLAKNGDIEKIKSLLEQIPELVNSKDQYGWTSLQIASLIGHMELVRLLIEKGARVNETDRFGFTALELAAIKGNSKICDLLVENGGILKVKDKKKPAKELKNKVESTDSFVPVIMSLDKKLIEVGLVPTSSTGKKGSKGHLSIDKKTIRRLKEAAEAFISKRIDINAKDNMGNTVLHIAAQKGEIKKVKILLEKKPLWVNSKNRFGITPLHYAAIDGHQEIATQLITAGANVNSKTNTGITPLYGAVSAGKKEMIRLLIQNGAKVNTTTGDSALPLHAATRRDIAEILVAAGARVKSVNKYGFTPLHIAAHYGYIEVADYLMSRGAKLEGRTKAGWTPLCEAVYNKKKAMVAFLAAKGARVNVRTWDGATPLKIASLFKDNEIIRVLRDYGAF